MSPTVDASRKAHFVVVGAFVADCVVQIGELPSWERDTEARSIRTTPGGKALNQAVSLARSGAHVTAVGVVGDDGAGRDVARCLVSEGVDTTHLEVREGVATPICVCLVGDRGETSFVYQLGNDVALDSNDIAQAKRSIEVADGVLVTFEAALPAVRATIASAKAHGTPVVVQPAPPRHSHEDLAMLRWSDIDLLVPNEMEGRLLAGDEQTSALAAEELAAAVGRKLSAPRVVVTLGVRGCVTFNAGTTRHFAARQVSEVIETTGASDAFTATLAFHLFGRLSSEVEAIEAALAAASLSVGVAGGYESMPNACAVDQARAASTAPLVCDEPAARPQV